LSRAAGLAPGGAYVIRIRLPAARKLVVRRRVRGRSGRSRTFLLPAGDYLYVGSALGPGGLAARVGRHLSEEKALHWDIDFLLSGPARPAAEVWARASPRRGLECRWAAALARSPGVTPVVGRREGERRAVQGFGAGDCSRRCGCGADAPETARTHLFRVEWEAALERVREAVGERAGAFLPASDLLGLGPHHA
jgi:Uri superfamily endonuclease